MTEEETEETIAKTEPADERLEIISDLIRDVPDFPKPGIMFKDITPLLADSTGFRMAITMMAEPFEEDDIDVVVGMESRGFIFGAAIAQRLGCGFVPVRKPGKLPAKANKEEYTLEYGTDALEMHIDAFESGARVLIVDDLIATGGTAEATQKLVLKQGGDIASYVFLLELDFLKGRDKLGDYPILSLIHVTGE